MSSSVRVACHESSDGWACRVTVGDDPGATSHEVTVTRPMLARLRPDDDAPDALVADSFAFLLAHEPRESILRSFELTEIGRYFAGWESEIRRS